MRRKASEPHCAQWDCQRGLALGFYVLFVPGVLMALIIWRCIRNSPAESHRVTPQERKDYDDDAAVQQMPIKATVLQSLRCPPQ